MEPTSNASASVRPRGVPDMIVRLQAYPGACSIHSHNLRSYRPLRAIERPETSYHLGL